MEEGRLCTTLQAVQAHTFSRLLGGCMILYHTPLGEGCALPCGGVNQRQVNMQHRVVQGALLAGWCRGELGVAPVLMLRVRHRGSACWLTL